MAEQHLQQERSLQPLSSRLGYMGLAPFVSLGAATFFAPASLHDLASQALLAYGATILSFLGGIYWGLAIANKPPVSICSIGCKLWGWTKSRY